MRGAGVGYVGCRTSGVGCAGCRLLTVLALFLHRSGTVPGTVLAPAWPGLMARICTRLHPGTARTSCRPRHLLSPGYTRVHTGTHPVTCTSVLHTRWPAGPTGLTLGCTSGHISPARHLAQHPHPIHPADRYPLSRTWCHPVQGHYGQRSQ